MRITKAQLQQIIHEELNGVLNEVGTMAVDYTTMSAEDRARKESPRGSPLRRYKPPPPPAPGPVERVGQWHLSSPLGQAAAWTLGKLTGQDPEHVESQAGEALSTIQLAINKELIRRKNVERLEQRGPKKMYQTDPETGELVPVWVGGE